MKTLLLTCALSIISLTALSQTTIVLPGSLESNTLNLNLQTGTFPFLPGPESPTMGINGPQLGPTLIMDQGDNMDITFNNLLGEDTTIHWHGMHVSAANDGGPHTVIPAGGSWNPTFEVKDKAGTYWYHPHLLHKTDEHASKGLAGFIIVRDPEEAALNLPRTYGVDDIPLAVQTKSFDANNVIEHNVDTDDVVMVNATIDGELEVPAQVVRLRLLNGSSQRLFNFGFTGDMSFSLIGTDGGLLNAPVALTRLPLAQGARAEILIDLTGVTPGTSIDLMSYASEIPNGNYGAAEPGNSSNKVLTGYSPNALNGADFKLLQLNVIAQTASPITTIPTTLASDTPWLEANKNETRAFTFSPTISGPTQLNGDFYINGVTMDMNTINVTVPLNNIETWTFQNNSGISHPFHMHDCQFYILEINGAAPPAYLQGRKDTFLIPAGGSAKIITKFEDYADDTIPYMYHCHMLKHEDSTFGMMGQFVVVNPTAGVDDLEVSDAVVLYPNPSKGSYMTVKLSEPSETIKAYSIVNHLGQIVRHHKVHENELNNMYSFPVFELAQGQYFIKVFTQDRIITKKFTKNH